MGSVMIYAIFQDEGKGKSASADTVWIMLRREKRKQSSKLYKLTLNVHLGTWPREGWP